MERIKPTLPKPTATTARSEREEQVQHFLDRINPGREAMKLKPLTHARFNKLVEGWGEKRDLYWLWSVCDKADNFSKMFWYHVKRSKEKV
jgi:hypothetical protein